MTVSVITPVYNAEAYLPRFLDSMLSQSFREWELLLVIDGSPDGSAAIADSYAAQDARIRVIRQENKGVSAARQVGMEAATGDYLIHADPDDWVEPDMLQQLVAKAQETGADVVLCDFYVTDAAGRDTLCEQRPSALNAETVLRELFHGLHGSCCNKLVRRDCLERFAVRFPEGINYCEDLLIWVQLLRHKEVTLAYVCGAFYHYVQYGSSITHRYTVESYRQRRRYQELLVHYLAGRGFEREIRKSGLVVFTEAYMRGILTDSEARKLLLSHLHAAFSDAPSRRWLAGYAALLLGCFPLAKRLLAL